MSKENSLSHDEQSSKMRREEQAAIMQDLEKQFPLLIEIVHTRQMEAVRAINIAQKMGGQIELYFGHNKLPESKFSQIAPALRDGETEGHIGFAKGLLSLSLRHKSADGKPVLITNPAIAAAELDRLEVQLKFIEAGTRRPIDDPDAPETEAQKRDRTVKSIYDQWTKMSLGWAEAAKELPPEKMLDYELDGLIVCGKPANELYKRAEAERRSRG